MSLASSPLVHEIRSLLPFLFRFLRHPVEGIRTAPRLRWPTLVILQAAAAMISGALLGILNASIGDFLLGLFIFPVTSLVISVAFTFFISYFFSHIRSTYLEPRRLYEIVAIANLPYFLFHAFSGFLPPIDLIGFALTAILLIVGMVEHFSLDKKTVMKLVGVIYLVFVLLWTSAQIAMSGNQDDARHPRSLDELERDMRH